MVVLKIAIKYCTIITILFNSLKIVTNIIKNKYHIYISEIYNKIVLSGVKKLKGMA